jgi:hypothetical protein
MQSRFNSGASLVLGLLVTLCSCTLDLAQADSFGFKVAESTHEFGSVPQGALVVHEFEVKNTGSKELQIQKITASCGCTAATVDASTIKVGEIGRIKVSFDTSGFSGAKTKTVEVLTSDSESPEFLLSLKGTVLPGITTEPRRIEFGELSPGGDQSRWSHEFSVSIQEGSALKVSQVRTFAKYLRVLELEKSELAARYRIEVLPDAPRGEIRDRVVVEFSGGRQQSVNIPVIGSIKGDLRLVPSTVSFGVIQGSQPLERRVRFENSAKQDVKVLSIVANNSAVSASLIDVQAGKRGVLVVRVDPALVTNDLRTTVDIETDHPTEPKLSLNVFGVQPPK